MLKRGHKGVYHKFSNKHPGRYVDEFAERHNMRGKDTVDQMATVAHGMGRQATPIQGTGVMTGMAMQKQESLFELDVLFDNTVDNSQAAVSVMVP